MILHGTSLLLCIWASRYHALCAFCIRSSNLLNVIASFTPSANVFDHHTLAVLLLMFKSFTIYCRCSFEGDSTQSLPAHRLLQILLTFAIPHQDESPRLFHLAPRSIRVCLATRMHLVNLELLSTLSKVACPSTFPMSRNKAVFDTHANLALPQFSLQVSVLPRQRVLTKKFVCKTKGLKTRIQTLVGTHTSLFLH